MADLKLYTRALRNLTSSSYIWDIARDVNLFKGNPSVSTLVVEGSACLERSVSLAGTADRKARLTRLIDRSYDLHSNDPSKYGLKAWEVKLPSWWTVEEVYDIRLRQNNMPSLDLLRANDTLATQVLASTAPAWLPKFGYGQYHENDYTLAGLFKRRIVNFAWKGCFSIEHLAQILQARLDEGFEGIPSLSIHCIALEQHGLARLLEVIAPHIQKLSIRTFASSSVGDLTLTRCFSAVDWSTCTRLRHLELPVTISEEDCGCPYTIEGYTGPPLHLDTFMLHFSLELGSQRSIQKMPSVSEIARAMVAIGGPACKFDFVPVIHKDVAAGHAGTPGHENDWTEADTRDCKALQILVNKEIQTILGRPSGEVGWKHIQRGMEV